MEHSSSRGVALGRPFLARLRASGEARLFLAVLLLASVVATPLPWWNENRTIDLLKAMARGSFWIDDWVAPGAPGDTPDKALVASEPCSAAVMLDGAMPGSVLPPRSHYYCGGAPGLAFFLYPVHEIAWRLVPDRLVELVLVLFGSALPLALGSVAVKRAVERGMGAKPGTAILAGAIHGLATTALPFGTRLYAHSLEVSLLAGSLAALLSPRLSSSGEKESSLAPAAIAGLLASAAVVCDYNVGTAALALFVLAFLRGGLAGGVAFAAGGLPPAVLLGWYHQVCFGSPWSTPYDHHADPGTRELVTKRYGFIAPSPRIVFEILFGSRRGFLWSQPAAFLGLAGLVSCARRLAGKERKLSQVALGAFAVILLAHASRSHDWHAGCSFGPRYSIASLPFLALGYPRGLELAGRAAKPILAISFFLALVGATNDWGGSMLGNLGVALVLGPRVRGLNELLLGTGPLGATAATSALAFFALPVALFGVVMLLRPYLPWKKQWAFPVLLLLPFFAALHFQYVTFMRRPGAVDAEYHDVIRWDMGNRIRAARDAQEAVSLAAIVAGWNERGLYLQALERAAELDPENPKIQQALENARRGKPK